MAGVSGRFISFIMRAGRVMKYGPKIRYILSRWRFEIAGTRGGIERGVRFLGTPCLYFGDRVTLRRDVIIGGNGTLIVGSDTTINEGVIISCSLRVNIGSDCMIGPRAYILDVGHQFESRLSPISKQGYTSAPVVIGDGVWVGAYAVILKGVSIGKGAIIGAHSVVSCDVPEYAIYAGAPARLVKMRPE